MLSKLRTFAKELLAIGWINWLYETANRTIFEIFGASRVLAHVLFSLFPLPFNREQAAVLRGRRDYYRRKNKPRQSRVELRRNIHRLEKGLVMMPRRPVFAADYIRETIDFYARAAAQFAEDPTSMDRGEFQWAHDVLDAYFAACVAPHPAVDAAREIFAELPGPASNLGLAPTLKAKRGASSITFDQLQELARQRRSVRFFDDRPVRREDIDSALEIASLAPTACNRMPYNFRVFDDPALVPEIASIPFGTVGYSDQIPVIIVLTGDLANYFSPRDRHAFYIDASLACMSFLFALETLGLSSCTINWPDFEPLEAKMQRKLGLDITERVVMLIAVGHAHPQGLVPYSEKKELDTFRSYNQLP